MADPIGPTYANCDCCTGSVGTWCCANILPDTLNITIVNSCGTYTGTLTYDPAYGSGVAKCWVGNISANCFGGGGPCAAHTVNILFCCQNTGGWTINVACDSIPGAGTTSSMSIVCNPFVATESMPLISCLQCATNITITV